MTIGVLVTADDRTGALETAGACADAGTGPVTVCVLGGSGVLPLAGGWGVVDLASRHLERPAAETAASTVADSACASGRVERHLHKVDSTLRGNWATEALAIARTRGERLLVVPALPGLGRVCTDGIVSVDGVAVHEGPLGADPRSPVWSSRPADHLRRAGAQDVAELADEDAVHRWLTHDGPIAGVCDAVSHGDIERIADAWAASAGVVLAGTSVAMAEAVRRVRFGAPRSAPSAPPFVAPVLVVCGSLHPAARAQIETLRRVRLEGVEVIASETPADSAVGHDEALRAASALATLVAVSDARTVVVLGGDTAAAVLGDRPVVVGGTAMPGAPWMRLDDGRLVVTRAGGFGDPAALARHIADRIVR